MHFSTIASLLLCALPFSFAAPVEQETSPYLAKNGSAVGAQDFDRDRYTVFVRNTNPKYAYFLQVLDVRSNSLRNSRNVQLRKAVTGDKWVGVIDAESPVAALGMTKGAIETAKVDFIQRPTPNGIYAKLGKKTTSNGGKTFMQMLEFVEADSPPDDGFRFDLIAKNGAYWLYHDTKNFVSSGWVLCYATDGVSTYYQLWYESYEGNGGRLPPMCSYAAVQTVIAPIDDEAP